LADLAPARQLLYAYLASAFSEPPCEDSLNALRQQPFIDAAKVLFREAESSVMREDRLASAASTEGLESARQEFANLFIVPGPQYVTPYESVFRDTREVAGEPVKGLLMGQPAMDVMQWYRLAALEIAEEYEELPDHIGLELNYLSELCAKEVEFAAEGNTSKLSRAREMQRDFLAGHVVLWVDDLCEKIHQKTRLPYFRMVASMASEVARRDLTTLEGLLGPSCGKSAPQPSLA